MRGSKSAGIGAGQPAAALVQRRGTGRSVATGRMTVEFLVTSDRTADGLGIYLLTLAPHAPGASPHYHARMSEVFHVQSGTLSLLAGAHVVDAAAGDVVLIPPGLVHAFANRSDVPAVFTLSFTPALGREGFFEGLAALAGKQAEARQPVYDALMAQYDQVPVAAVAGWTAS